MKRSLAPLALLAALLASAPASGQDPGASASVAQQGSAPAATAHEEFDLNIADRRITEDQFQASLEVQLRTGPSEEEGLGVRVGALVGARRIDVRLRNVRGRVRFIASLARVEEVVNSHRAAAR
jgi:hypothetical protein